ncbi:SusC/RagA family TonB-linked outer membrane protein [Mangrovibacterium sp.]|uniref:SusC/RagA family TonB-linked outer membrane protein n=1 Tax=Mangrovibacterium sp. TaxID=1961364 RepID=UPI0035672BEB
MKQKSALKRVGLLMLLFLWGIGSFAQSRVITGKVTDNGKSPLPGVTVVYKGTTNGTITNADGNYTLKADPEAKTLVFTYIGMISQEVAIGNSATINVTLEPDVVGVDEVVVVGYGTQKKSDITGSVISVNKDIMETRPRVSVEQMLQGAAAGLSITVNSSSAEGSSNTMLIRGQNSISASNSPLIILDGIPYAGNLSELNPKDIESIEILKDASSSAIYGSRGSNGVILITSKKGKAGEMVVNYTGTYAIDNVINVPDLMDGKTFYETKAGRGLTTTAVEDEGYESGRSTDWVDLATQTGHTQNHNLSFRGGTERTKYYLSMAYLNADGVAVGDKFKRYSFRINLDHKILPWITFSTSTQYGYYDRSGISASFEDAFTMNPLGVPYNDDGTIKMETWDDGVYAGNPLNSLLYENSNITRRFTSNNSVLFELPFVKGLSYNLNTGYDYRSSLSQTYRGTNTLVGTKVNGSLDSNNGYDEDWIIENIVTYKNEFGKHSIFLTGLYSAQSEWSEDHDVHAEGFPNDVMTYYQANKASLIEPDDSYTKKTHLSQMLRANYVYDNRYLLTLTVRRDGYSAFGEDSKFGLFPSAAFGWNVANEKFMDNIDLIDVLKLRISYGVSGNEAVSAYSTLATLSTENYVDGSDGTLYGFYPSSLGDPSLSWETTASFNTGLDFGLFNNRLKGLIDLYWSKTTDLLLKKSISNVNGTGSITQNIGETSNSGIEFQLSSVNIDKGKFKWTSDFNIAHYNTKIVNVGLTDPDTGDYIDDVDSKWFIGEPVDVNYHYVFDGIYQEDLTDTPQGDVVAGDIRYLDASGDGVISADDKRVIGRTIPDFVAGLTNTFKYKNWTLSVFMNAVVGITKENELLYTNDNDMRLNRYNVTFWTPENMSNIYPRNDAHASVNKYSMPFYRKADFLRIQDISLSYKVPKILIEKYKINNVEVFANIKNLATWTDWVGLDPEFSDQTAVPQTATVLFGVKIGL